MHTERGLCRDSGEVRTWAITSAEKTQVPPCTQPPRRQMLREWEAQKMEIVSAHQRGRGSRENAPELNSRRKAPCSCHRTDYLNTKQRSFVQTISTT